MLSVPVLMVAAETAEPTLPPNLQPEAGRKIDHAPLVARVAETWLYPPTVSCPNAGAPKATRAPITAIFPQQVKSNPQFYDKRRYVPKNTKFLGGV